MLQTFPYGIVTVQIFNVFAHPHMNKKVNKYKTALSKEKKKVKYTAKNIVYSLEKDNKL